MILAVAILASLFVGFVVGVVYMGHLAAKGHF
jgi:hypothetical protein